MLPPASPPETWRFHTGQETGCCVCCTPGGLPCTTVATNQPSTSKCCWSSWLAASLWHLLKHWCSCWLSTHTADAWLITPKAWLHRLSASISARERSLRFDCTGGVCTGSQGQLHRLGLDSVRATQQSADNKAFPECFHCHATVPWEGSHTGFSKPTCCTHPAAYLHCLGAANHLVCGAFSSALLVGVAGCPQPKHAQLNQGGRLARYHKGCRLVGIRHHGGQINRSAATGRLCADCR